MVPDQMGVYKESFGYLHSGSRFLRSKKELMLFLL